MPRLRGGTGRLTSADGLDGSRNGLMSNGDFDDHGMSMDYDFRGNIDPKPADSDAEVNSRLSHEARKLIATLVKELKASRSYNLDETKLIRRLDTALLSQPPRELVDNDASDSVPGPQALILATALGASVINSSDEPVAAIHPAPHLPSARSINGSAHPWSIATGLQICRSNGTAAKSRDHALVWRNAINAGRTGSALVVNGNTLLRPSIITADSSNNLVKVPLNIAVDSQSAVVPASQSITIAAIGLPPATYAVSRTLPTKCSVIIPSALLVNNLVGNEDTTVPAGFVLAGDVRLFGGKISAELYTFQGTAGDDGKSALVVISQSPVAMDDLLPIPHLSFGKIMLQHPSLSVYLKNTSSGRDAGLWLDAELRLDGTMSDLRTVLKDILVQEPSSLDISGHIGGYSSFNDALKAPNDLLLTAKLVGLNVTIGRFLELTTLQVDIHGSKDGSGYTWTESFSGDALLTVPGSVAPLQTTFILSKTGTTYSMDLRLVQTQWKDAMGVPGFHLHNTMIKTSFTTASKDSAFAFDISASFALGNGDVSVQGHFSSHDWSFQANVGDMTLQDLKSAFHHMFNAELTPSSHDVSLTGLLLDVNSEDKALVLKGSVDVDGYTSSTASLSIGATGLHLQADMANVAFDQVLLTKAHMELIVTKQASTDVAPVKPATASAFTISGELQVNGSVTLQAEVSFAKETGSLLWVVYAKATANLSISKFVKKIPADLDFTLKELVVMASNTDNGSLFPAHIFTYTVKKGFTLRAEIDCPPSLAKALRTNPVGIVLELDLASAAKEIDLLFSSDENLSLKPGMLAPRIKAGIELTGQPELFVEGDMKVQLSGQPEPLDFSLRLQVGDTEAQALASLTTDWVNPFHISPQVKVLAPVTLGVIIDYAAATYPSGLSFQGGIQIGEASLHAAFEVGENPQDGVLITHAENLDITDIVSFVSLIIQHHIPLPPRGFLEFKALDFGISSGGTIGPTFYPPGATYNADMLLFGKEFKINCVVDKSLPGMTIHAELDAFDLGPLKVSGNTFKNPTFDLVCGTKLQQFLIDGKIALFDADIATTIQLVMVPPKLTFDAELKFSELLFFKLEATAAGEIKSIKDVVKADFSLHAEFEQHLLDYMMALANTYIATGKKAADEGLDSAKEKLDEVQKLFNDGLTKAQRDLDHAQAIWDKKSADVNAVVDAKKKAILDEERSALAAVDSARKSFDDKIAELTQSLTRTKNDANGKIQAAQRRLNTATQDADRSIESASRKLSDAERDMTNRFGDADQKLRNAEDAVTAAGKSVDNFQDRINDDNYHIQHDKWYQIPDRTRRIAELSGLYVALGAAKGALAVANKVVEAARSVVHSVGYEAAKAAITVAQAGLTEARKAADESIAVAGRSLREAQAAADASIHVAQVALDVAKTSSQELHVWDIAKTGLAAFEKSKLVALAAADALITGLMKSVEKLAFDAAEAALAVARSATKELNAAKAVLQDVESAVDEFSAFGMWLSKHVGNIFNVEKVELNGSLNDASNKKPFKARLVGTFADHHVDAEFEFTPGQAEDFVKGIVMKYINEAKADITKFIH